MIRRHISKAANKPFDTFEYIKAQLDSFDRLRPRQQEPVTETSEEVSAIEFKPMVDNFKREHIEVPKDKRELVADMRKMMSDMMTAQLPTAERLAEFHNEMMEKRIDAKKWQGLTPAQRFVRDNKELLLKRAEESLLNTPTEIDDVEEDWKFYRDPVVRPKKGHLWTYGESEEVSYVDDVIFDKGKLPSPESIAAFLAKEQAVDTKIVNLNDCARRDIAETVLISTVKTGKHGRRLGGLLVSKVRELEIANIACYCPADSDGEWLTVHLGPILVHLMTASTRERYNLEAVLFEPEIWISAQDFPHYKDFWAPPFKKNAAPLHDDSVHQEYQRTDNY